MSSIPIVVAKEELERINNAVDRPLLLVGGLAVQFYIKSRDSHDIDIVCDRETTMHLMQTLYPVHQWSQEDVNDDDERPSFRITRRDRDMAPIYIGPKHVEREPYTFIDWKELARNATRFSHRKKVLENIRVPSAAALAYSKFISYCARRRTKHDKAAQDLQDFCDLTQERFYTVEFVGYAIKLNAVEYIQRQYSEMPSADRKKFEVTSFFKAYHLFLGDADTHGISKSSSASNGSSSPPAGAMPTIEEEILRIASKHQDKTPLRVDFSDSLLIIVDVQNDFMEGGQLAAFDSSSLIDPLNELVQRAHGTGCKIVYTRDWHPENHFSFHPWGKHCIQNESGAAFHPNMHLVDGRTIANIGENDRSDPYSPFSDARLLSLIAMPEIRTVYIAGIALEFCVLATCRDALCFGKTVIALEPYIRSASDDASSRENTWAVLVALGAIRAQNAPFPLLRRVQPA